MAVAHPVVARCFIVLDNVAPGAELSVPYVMPLVMKVNRRNASLIARLDERWLKIKAGGALPQAPP